MALKAEDVEIKVSSDRMEATLTLVKGNLQGSFTVEDLQEILQGMRVNSGILVDRLQHLVKTAEPNVPHVVARGKQPVDGEHEKASYTFPTSRQTAVEETESGSVDFRNISNFNNIKEGTVLAEKTPATSGEPGFNVMGEQLKARDGKTISLRIGKGAELSEDGMRALAKVNGHACLVADRICVLETVEVPAHVDYSIGNISFIGNVRVRGGVMPGFVVEAQGNIEITGNVEKATIKCGGDLDIRGIVFGQGDCTIEVNGDARLGAIDQAKLSVRGDLKANSYIRHCEALVGGAVEVLGKKGNIVGGEVHAFRGITAPFIGNNMATLTKLTVGSNPFVSHELTKLEQQHNELSGKLAQVLNALDAALARKQMSGGVDEKTEGIIEKLKQARTQLEPAVAKVKKELEETKARVSEFKESRIRVGEIVYPGVVVNFRNRLQYKTMDEAQRVSFYEEEAEIRTGPY